MYSELRIWGSGGFRQQRLEMSQWAPGSVFNPTPGAKKPFRKDSLPVLVFILLEVFEYELMKQLERCVFPKSCP